MHIYYLYSQNKEISKYILDSLNPYDVTIIKDSSKLFDINEKNAILLLHIESYEQDIIELVTYLQQNFKELKILALSNNINFSTGTSLLQAGVKGYGNIYMHSVLLKQAIDVIMSSNIWIYPELASHLIQNLTKNETISEEKLTKLSQHERECAKLAYEGNSNKEIAALLDVQEITIKKHLSSVYKKLSLKNRMELALYFRDN